MYLSLWDWAIIASFLLFVVAVVLFATRHVRSVADFIAGRRMAGRYLLTVAGEMGGFGAVSVIAIWEAGYNAGWGATFWSVLSQPFALIIVLSGWVIYRYRQTRALTLAQFFEQRYSRRFRVASGLLAFLSGTLNYAIFPSVGARFLIYVCGFPEHIVLIGDYPFSITYAVVMAALLGFALWITLKSGQIGIMLSDGLQGIICLLMTVMLAHYLILRFGWEQIGHALMAAPNPDTASMIHPFKTGATRDFNIWFYLIAIFGSFYGRMAWQGNSGYNAAAKSPHEARMAGVLGILRSSIIMLVMGFICMAAYTMMHHPDFAREAAMVHERVAAISNPAIQKQMTVPIAISVALPIGLLGCLVAIVISMAVTTDDTYLHSWGSIFIQDVIMPFRKEPFTPEAHLRALRWSIAGVAIFAYLFSLFFRQTQYILMFFAITGSIFTAGAGSAIIGGLYWKRGTTAGAWAALLTGAILSVGGIVLQQQPFHRTVLELTVPDATAVRVNEGAAVRNDDGVWRAPLVFWRNEEWQGVRVLATYADGATATSIVQYAYGRHMPQKPMPVQVVPDDESALLMNPVAGALLPVEDTPRAQFFYRIRSLSGQVLWFFSMISAIAMYVVFSLASRRVHDMDRLLHRGAHSLSDVPNAAPVRGWRAVFGVTTEFTRGDRIIYFTAMTWSLGWMAIYLALIAMNLVSLRSDEFWVLFQKYKFYTFFAAGLITSTWFGIGAIRDTVHLVRDLSASAGDAHDDGWVDTSTAKEKPGA
jgi:SSS family solute:Na+ symporter